MQELLVLDIADAASKSTQTQQRPIKLNEHALNGWQLYAVVY